MRREGREGPGGPGNTGQPRSRGIRLGRGKSLEVHCSLGRKNGGLVEAKGLGIWRVHGFLVAPREAN